jgi:nucleotide-binding universal stress UspA family protein
MSTAVTTPRHVLRVADLAAEELTAVIDLAARMKANPAAWTGALPGLALAALFEKPSTRTRASLAVAAHRLGMLPLTLRPDELQLGRGETIADSARVLSGYAAAIAVRTFAQTTLEELAAHATVPVINALSDDHHPCQALADLLTLRERFGTLHGIKLAYVGDGNNVAHSLLEAGALAGVSIVVASAPGYGPDDEVTDHAFHLQADHGGVPGGHPRPRPRRGPRERRLHRRVGVDGRGRGARRPPRRARALSRHAGADGDGGARRDLPALPPRPSRGRGRRRRHRRPAVGGLAAGCQPPADRAGAHLRADHRRLGGLGMSRPATTPREEHTMFTKIIVGVDAREGGRDALALADAFARLSGGELVAVHAYPYDHHMSPGASTGFEEAMHGAAMETLEDELKRSGVSARAIAVPDGSPGRALHLAAEREHADLIVVGSAHRGRIGCVLAGDVTAGTLHSSPCPVVVAPAGYAQHGATLGTIGVGYDGSLESRAALALAHDLAEAAGARLRIIDVVVPPEPGGPFPAYRPDWTEHARIRREEAEERLERITTALGEIATGDIAFGDPATELAFEANHLDLLVTGSRNYGPIRRLLLGSTSSKLVHQAPCPVLVTTRSVEDDVEAAEAASAVARAS